jgi:hypothetical protein
MIYAIILVAVVIIASLLPDKFWDIIKRLGRFLYTALMEGGSFYRFKE